MAEIRPLDANPADVTDSDGGWVALDTVSTRGSTLTVEFETGGPVGRFFTDEPLRVAYPASIAAVEREILVVPALAQVCPVAWATGADVIVDSVDPEFLVALHRVRESLKGLYPSLVQRGTIHCEDAPTSGVYETLVGEESRESQTPADRSSALLFTGGVDSLASYIRHQQESPLLVGVQGWALDDDWEHMQNHVDRFAERHGCETAFLRSNVAAVLDTPKLEALFRPHLRDSWFSAVGYGLGLLGLCAPLCRSRGIETLYISATHSGNVAGPCGSHPTIDDNVSWTGTTARHDCNDLTRQRKLESIASFSQKHDPDLQIRSCGAERAAERNCGACEKCYRNIVGLTIAGVDPRTHGYPVTAETFQDIRSGFESGRWYLSTDRRLMWRDLQAAAREQPPVACPGAQNFLTWLAGADIEDLVASPTPTLTDRLLHGILRRSPERLYRSLYSIHRRARQVFR